MTETPTIYQLTNHGTAPVFNAAFAAGCGGRVVNGGPVRPGPVALWGEHKFWPTLQAAIAEGRTWYYGDHAYFGRNIFYRITKNALQHTGIGPADLARLDFVRDRLQSVRGALDFSPQQNDLNGFILLCPPSEPCANRAGFTQAEWTRIVTRKLRRITNRELRIRQKPKVNRAPAPLLEALRGAYALVTFTSNVAVESLVAGFPAICTGSNPIHAFGRYGINALARLTVPSVRDRMEWASVLCANQWTLEEIKSGKAWESINGLSR